MCIFCGLNAPSFSGGTLSRRGLLWGTGAFTATAALAPEGGSQAQAAAAQASRLPPARFDDIRRAVDADTERLTRIFKDIHQNPELAFKETRTAEILANELSALGFEVTSGIGRTGVVGILRNGSGPTVMFRADMDALPIEEASNLPYASKVRVMQDSMEVPVSHMCGHDAHVTWILGMAKVLANGKQHWKGTLVLVGQPAEEPLLGAAAMVNDGLYARHGVPVPDLYVALHTIPGPVGTVLSASGVRMAGSDQLDVTFHGNGGHGSMPQFAKDPVIMAAMAVAEYQMIISRVVDPQETAVLTVGSIHAGTDNNIIPETATLKLNLRWFKPETRETMLTGIRSIGEGLAKAYGLPDSKMPTITMKGSTTPLINDKGVIDRLNPALERLLGEGKVVTDIPQATGSEDAHLLLGDHKVPYAYLLVGVADPNAFEAARKEGKPLPYTNHDPKFVVDLAAIPVGAKVAAVAVLELLSIGK